MLDSVDSTHTFKLGNEIEIKVYKVHILDSAVLLARRLYCSHMQVMA